MTYQPTLSLPSSMTYALVSLILCTYLTRMNIESVLLQDKRRQIRKENRENGLNPKNIYPS